MNFSRGEVKGSEHGHQIFYWSKGGGSVPIVPPPGVSFAFACIIFMNLCVLSFLKIVYKTPPTTPIYPGSYFAFVVSMGELGELLSFPYIKN